MAIQIKTDDGLVQDFPNVNDTLEAPIIDSGIIAAANRAAITVIRTENLYQRERAARKAGYDDAYDEVKAALRDHFSGDVDSLRSVFKSLGLVYVQKYRVRVEIEGYEVLSVIVEADDEYEAERMVSDNFHQSNTEVEVDFDFSGDGDVEDSNSYEYEFGTLSDFLSIDFYAEEYEGE